MDLLRLKFQLFSISLFLIVFDDINVHKYHVIWHWHSQNAWEFLVTFGSTVDLFKYTKRFEETIKGLKLCLEVLVFC